MKISILLPYKENFSPDYAGAVSLNINDTLKISKYNNNTIVFGNTKYKNVFNLKYKNISLDKKLFQSQNKKYVEEFIKLENKRNSDLIELHNRPIYLVYLIQNLNKKTYILYFHNDPLSMTGSKTIADRIFLMKSCFKIIFNSNWSKRRFLKIVTPIKAQAISIIRSTAVARTPCVKPEPRVSDKNPTANSLEPMSLWSIGIRRIKADTVVNR